MQERQSWNYGVFIRNGDEDALKTVEKMTQSISWYVTEGDIDAAMIEVIHHSGGELIVQYDIRQIEDERMDWRTELSAIRSQDIRYIQPSGSPNLKIYYQQLWGQASVFERYFQLFSLFAGECVKLGLKVVFPLLVPGGDYWDTVFLRSILNQLVKTGSTEILNSLVLCAGGYTFGKDLNWGDGGAARWVMTRPYHTPEGSEDHQGINTWQWYAEIGKDVTGCEIPIFIYHAGSPHPDGDENTTLEPLTLVQQFPRSTDLADGQHVCFWPSALVDGIQTLAVETETASPTVSETESGDDIAGNEKTSPKSIVFGNGVTEKHIEEYVFLPTYEWGVADWHLEIVASYIKKSQSTLGFSLEEAKYARRVLLVAIDDVVTAGDLKMLRDAGCEVTIIRGDGTEIAQQLASL